MTGASTVSSSVGSHPVSKPGQPDGRWMATHYRLSARVLSEPWVVITRRGKTGEELQTQRYRSVPADRSWRRPVPTSERGTSMTATTQTRSGAITFVIVLFIVAGIYNIIYGLEGLSSTHPYLAESNLPVPQPHVVGHRRHRVRDRRRSWPPLLLSNGHRSGAITGHRRLHLGPHLLVRCHPDPAATCRSPPSSCCCSPSTCSPSTATS